MPTALDYADATEEFFKGNDPGYEYRTKYNADNIVGNQSSGSQNIPLVQARNALIYHELRKNMENVSDILDAWNVYADGDFMTSETFSCNIYAAWIWESIQVAHAAAQAHNHPAKHGLLKHLKTAMALCSLASGWVKNTAGFDGYPCVMTGARSWNGPHRYMTSASSFGSGWLAAQLMLSKPGWFYNGLSKVFGYKMPITDVTPFYRVVKNAYDEGELEYLQAVLDNGPKSRVSAKIIRTDNSVFWGNYSSINTGSTCFLPGKGWTLGPNPYRHHKWSPDATSMWLSVDRPLRKWGGTVQGQFTRDNDEWVYSAQRVKKHKDRIYPNNSYWDEDAGIDVMGWRRCLIPGKERLVVDIIQNNGYKIHTNGESPPKPPPSGNGWHTIVMDKAYLKFTDEEAAEALAAINAGKNHLPIHSVAFEPAELEELKYELERL